MNDVCFFIMFRSEEGERLARIVIECLRAFGGSLVKVEERTVFLDRLEQQIEIAARINCRKLIICSGNRLPDVPFEAQLANAISVMAEAARGADAHVTVMHSAAPAEATALAAELRSAIGTPEVPIMNLVPAVVTHAGPGALAVGFFAPV